MSGAGAAALIVGTAGHIDHGKTTLVRALTGLDLDTLPEEKERGITIALGFAPFDLPDGRRIAFVDVPGHERLVRTMVAGATGIDAVLLCVSAVEGVMPQTREHLDILGLLDVREGLVALTMADLVDADLLELAREDVAETVRGTFLEGKPILAVSAVTGSGREEILAALSALKVGERDRSGAFRLPVDRSFVRPGFGTVVTGTVWSGVARDGDQVRLLPQETPARIRGIQVHGKPSETAEAGWRAALNLAGVERTDVPRGTVVASGNVPSVHVMDVRYRHLPREAAIEDGTSVRVLLGTAESLGRIHVADDLPEIAPGQVVWAQIRLETALPALPGDRFVVRRPSPQRTLGGGEVVDPWARRMRQRDRVRWGEEIARLYEGDVSVWLLRAGEEGLEPDRWAERARGSRVGEVLGDRVFAPAVVGRLEGALLEALARFHEDHPLSLGANRRELRRERIGHLSERVFDALVDRLASTGTVEVQGPLLRLAGFAVRLDPARAALRDKVLATIAGAGLSGIAAKDLQARHPEEDVAALMHLLSREGRVEEVEGLGWVAASELDGLRKKVAGWFAKNEELTPGQLKDMTGLSRKGAIPLLEWLDRNKVTRRSGDVRRAGGALGK